MNTLIIKLINFKKQDEEEINITVDENLTVYDLKIEISATKNVPISNIHIVKSETELTYVENSFRIINMNFFQSPQVLQILKHLVKV